MKTLLRILLYVLIGLPLLLFATANRHEVTVALDPFPNADIVGQSVSAPLFVVLILTGMIGVLAGGAAVWLRQGRDRKSARMSRAEAADLRSENDRLRAQVASLTPVRGSALIEPPAKRDVA